MWLRRLAPEPACRAATIDQRSQQAAVAARKKHGRRRCPQTDLRQLIRLFQLHVLYSILTIVFLLNRGREFLLGQEVDVRHSFKWQLTNQGWRECESEGGAATAGGGVC